MQLGGYTSLSYNTRRKMLLSRANRNTILIRVHCWFGYWSLKSQKPWAVLYSFSLSPSQPIRFHHFQQRASTLIKSPPLHLLLAFQSSSLSPIPIVQCVQWLHPHRADGWGLRWAPIHPRSFFNAWIEHFLWLDLNDFLLSIIRVFDLKLFTRVYVFMYLCIRAGLSSVRGRRSCRRDLRVSADPQYLHQPWSQVSLFPFSLDIYIYAHFYISGINTYVCICMWLWVCIGKIGWSSLNQMWVCYSSF